MPSDGNTPASPTIVVIGVTGRQGGAAARHLVKSGKWQVKGISRHPDSQEAKSIAKELNIDVVKADCMDTASLLKVFEGAYGVYAVTNPFTKRWSPFDRDDGSVDGEVKQGRNIVDACIERDVRHLVFSSVAHALDNTGVPTFEAKAEVERYIKAKGYSDRTTVLGPVGFFENVTGPYGIKQGTVPSLLKGKKAQLIATDDIGWFVAKAFDQPQEWLGRRLDIAGDDLTSEEQASTMARLRKLTGADPPGAVWSTSTPPDWVFKLFIPKAVGTLKKFLEEKGCHVDIGSVKAIHPGLMNFEEFCIATGMDKKPLAQPSSCAVM